MRAAHGERRLVRRLGYDRRVRTRSSALGRRPRASPARPAVARRHRPHPRPVPRRPAAARQAYHDDAIFAWEREEIFYRDWLAVARAEDIAEPGSFLLRDVLDEQLLLVRGQDDVIRAFYNVCRHRGTAVEERECGTAVRFQCPYHAWIYDLDGRLVRAKHTDDLEDFTFEGYGLPPIRTETWQGFVFLCFADESVTPGLQAYMGDPFEHHASFGRDMSSSSGPRG